MRWRDLAQYATTAPEPAPAGTRPSAVLIGIVDDGEAPRVILTERAAHLRHHAGQISFPGGRIEPGEDALGTALREAWEEVALPEDSLEVIGYLPGVVTTAGFHIAPVLARLSAMPALKADPGEVKRILIEPVEELLKPENHLAVQRQHEGIDYWSWTIRHEREHIWGATARVIVQWAQLADPKKAKVAPVNPLQRVQA